MARVRMVTRTVKGKTIECMCLNTATAEVSINTYTLGGENYTVETALKELQKQHNTDTFKLVAIQSMTDTEEMYGMLESEFLKSAKKLDPETRKAIETE